MRCSFGAKHADATLSSNYRCAKDGTFEISVPKAGVYSLRVSAPNHEEVAIPLYLDGSAKLVEMAVQLKANPFNTVFTNVMIVGDWNKFEFSSADTLSMMLAADGHPLFTYTRLATGDTMSYQLLGIAGSHSVNGQQADYPVYDGGGDYRSVIRTKKGEKVTIVFDPQKLNFATNGTLPTVHVKNNPFLEKAVNLSMNIAAMHTAALTFPKDGGAVTASGAKLRAMLEFIKADIEKERTAGDTMSMQYAAVSLAGQSNMDTAFWNHNARMILTTLPASSPLWSLAPQEASYLTFEVDTAFGHAYSKQLESNPESSVRAAAFVQELEGACLGSGWRVVNSGSKSDTVYIAKNDKEWKRLYAMLKQDYSDDEYTQMALKRFNPDAIVMVGKRVPEFEVTILGTNQIVSDKSMLGRYYLIDFWATWCGPCVGEMPAIHKAYEKFKGKKGFEIVSLSMDGYETAIAPFRKKWPMPWINAFIPGVFEAELAKKFEVVGIPDPVLVGPDGTIVATSEDLRGGTLELTLNRFLGERN